MAIQTDIQHATHAPGVPSAEQFRSWVGAIRHPQTISVCIRVVGEVEMAKLNERYRGKAGATNVLAFEADRIERDQGCLGDLIICAPEVLREARQYGYAPDARFAHMTIHGLLHLLGHTHSDAGTMARMEEVEREVMERLGYPDPYVMP